MSETNVYQENGYANRKEYLQCLSEDYDIPYTIVVSLAQLLGENEDFDGLVSALEDYEGVFAEDM